MPIPFTDARLENLLDHEYKKIGKDMYLESWLFASDDPQQCLRELQLRGYSPFGYEGGGYYVEAATTMRLPNGRVLVEQRSYVDM